MRAGLVGKDCLRRLLVDMWYTVSRLYARDDGSGDRGPIPDLEILCLGRYNGYLDKIGPEFRGPLLQVLIVFENISKTKVSTNCVKKISISELQAPVTTYPTPSLFVFSFFCLAGVPILQLKRSRQ